MLKLILASLLFVSIANASPIQIHQIKGDYEVDATATMVDYDASIAEVCGVLKGPVVSQRQITVVADYKRRPGYYNTNTNKVGRFCQMVYTPTRKISIVLPE